MTINVKASAWNAGLEYVRMCDGRMCTYANTESGVQIVEIELNMHKCGVK